MTADRRDRVFRRWSALKNERSAGWDGIWRDVATYVRPRAARFLPSSETNRFARDDEAINNGFATDALERLAAGMMAGVTSPARVWARLTTADPQLDESPAVRRWLDDVRTRMFDVFHRSNLYKCLPICYEDLGSFGVAAMLVDRDYEDVIRCYPLPVGTYCLASSGRGSIDTMFRELRLTVAQVVGRWGDGSASARVREAWRDGRYDDPVDILHVIEPNRDHDPSRAEARFKRYRSLYFERDTDDGDGCLSESGYDEFPVLCPRWRTVGEDVYGYSPAMKSLGDIKQLQFFEEVSADAFEMQVDPPMVGPSALRTQPRKLEPGATVYLDIPQGMTGFQPAHVPTVNFEQVDVKISRLEQRIGRAFFNDLFLMMLSDQRNARATATEVQELREEKMLQLGPVLESLQDELLDPLIKRTFAVMVEAGLVEAPPDELAGAPLRVEYLSILSQAQKLVGLGGLERLAAFSGQLAQVWPQVTDKFDADAALEEAGDMLGTPAKVLRSGDELDAVRQARAQQESAAQAAASAGPIAQAAGAARDLSQTDVTDQGSALSQLLAGMTAGGYLPVGGAA